MKRPASWAVWLGLAATLALVMMTPLAGRADERILLYHADVAIAPNGELAVTEEIRVRAEGNEIRRGIYREFPTDYRDQLGNHYRVDFTVLSVDRDGMPEPWHTKRMRNGTRIYIGSEDHLLNPGEYTYRVRFTTNRQLGYFEDHDELWWNVTGNGWGFPIDRASARITLPFEVPAANLALNAYTGGFGSKESAAEGQIIDGRHIDFATIRSLMPYENLSVVVGWPKGLMAEPDTAQKIRWFARDNGAAIVLLAGLLFSLAWYAWAWLKAGRDPAKGVIIPRFEPPTGLSPAGSRYVLDMSFDQKSFIAAIISLAVKGFIRIEQTGEEFTLERLPGRGKVAPTDGESAVLDELLPHYPVTISMTDENYLKFQKARSALKKALKEEHLGRLFHLNTLYLAPPLVVTALSGLVALAFRGGPAAWLVWAFLALVMHAMFIWLMRAPTPSGRRIMDEIEGFRMYLDTAEQDRLDRMKSPALTPEVFETFLPYAYALGVENHWCERFAREVPEDVRSQSGYQPSWYAGQFHGLNAINHLGDNFSSSLSTAISSASSPPGSSSGSGGGGYSGGGGGGGGGGGW